MSNYAIVVNTHSSSKDVWPMFFGQLEKHFSNVKTYVFTDNGEGIDSKYNVILYDSKDKFRTQYLKSIKQVSEEFIIYLNEDYILYDDVKVDKINRYVEVLKNNPEISFVRFTRGPNMTGTKLDDDLYYLDLNKRYFFSQTAGIWRRSSIEEVHELGPDTHIGVGGAIHGHFEVDANKVCKQLKMIGLISHNNEPRRGNHYDSIVFPYIATAIIKGKWNVSQYRNEIQPLINQYNVDVNIRGTV